MIELLAGTAGILAVLLVIAVVFAITYRQERDDAWESLDDALSDVMCLQDAKDSLARSLHATELNAKRLADENTELQRENGRFAAEIRALKATTIKRDPATGRMLPNPNAKRPRKSRAKDAPIACG